MDKTAGTYTIEFIGEEDGARQIDNVTHAEGTGNFLVLNTKSYGTVTVNLNAVKLFRFDREE